MRAHIIEHIHTERLRTSSVKPSLPSTSMARKESWLSSRRAGDGG